MFNEIAAEYLKNSKKHDKTRNIRIPIIGFDFDLSSIKSVQLKNIIKKIMENEKINPRDFIISQMPELASEGGFRDLFFELKDLKILEMNEDELNRNKKKAGINFTLPKSCYATVALEFFFPQP